MTDEYKTIEIEVHAETRVRGSRFIAAASPVSTKEAAEQFMARIRKSHHDAAHNCHAYRLGFDAQQFRYNDNGEPNGAGKPILTAIDKHGLTNTIVVVTRYFGGAKLGVGGLARAYGDAAEQVLSSAKIVTRYHFDHIRVSFPHSCISNVMHVISKSGARIIDTVYDEEVHLEIEIRQSRAAELKAALVEHTSGNIRLTPGS